MDFWTKATQPTFVSANDFMVQERKFMNYWRDNKCSWELTRDVFISSLENFNHNLDSKLDKMSYEQMEKFKFLLSYVMTNIKDKSFSNISTLEPIVYQLVRIMDSFKF